MAFEAYLYVDGVPGSSTSETGKSPKAPTGVTIATLPTDSGPIEIQNYGLNIEMPLVENRSATGAVTVGRANFEDFETSKNLDVSTNALLYYCLSGRHIPKAVVLIYRSVGDDTNTGQSTLYMQIEYEHIIITEVSVEGGGDELPKETLKFNYGFVKYTYVKTDKKTGKPNGSVFFEWDRTENSGDKSG